jgi:hypothetical protein
MDKGGPLLPVRIAARDMVRYDADANLILFAGDSQCALVSGEPNAVENYTLKAPRIAIELLDDKEMQAIAATTDLKHLRADGGGVTLRMTTTTQAGATAAAPGAQAITGAEMTCRECDFNPTPGQGTFEALGPGTILLNNAGAAAQTEGAFPTGDRPYYAGLKGFDTLKYHVDESIVADGHVQDMLFDYFPVIAGNVDLEQRIHVEASHVEIALIKKPTGGLELGSVRATGHVSYRDKKIDLKASGLSYDHNTQWMEMWSETDEPCYINGIPTTTIKFNLKTGVLSEAEIKGPGSVPLGL